MQSQKKNQKNTKKSPSISYLVFEEPVFSHRLSVGLVSNRCNLTATSLYETYNIPFVKKCNRFIVFLEHKLYGFPQSEV